MMRRPSASARLIGRGRGRVDLVALGLDAVILDALDADRLKRAVADVQGDLRDLDAARRERGDAAPA